MTAVSKDIHTNSQLSVEELRKVAFTGCIRITYQIDDADALVAGLMRNEFCQRAVAAAIIDTDIFKGERQACDFRIGLCEETSITDSSLNMATTKEVVEHRTCGTSP